MSEIKPFLTEGDLALLKREANSLAAYYFAPLYIVGSCLQKQDWRDVDIVCILPDEHFSLRFGDYDKWYYEGATGEYTKIRWNWARECCKRWRELSRISWLNIDFKVISEKHDMRFYKDRPKYRIDTSPFKKEKFNGFHVIGLK